MTRCIAVLLFTLSALLGLSHAAVSRVITSNENQNQQIREKITSAVGQHVLQNYDSSEPQIVSLRRQLGDFDDLNKLFDGLVLGLPDFDMEAGKFLGATLKISSRNLRCFSMSIEDVILKYRKRGNWRFTVDVSIRDLAISCDLNFSYKWSFASGSGRAQVYTDNNQADTGILFTSKGFDQHPPDQSSVSQCNAAIGITDMDFQGGIVSTILDVFERSMRGMVADQINTAACQELGSLGTTLVEDMLEYVYDLIEKYLGELPPGYDDVLGAENQLVIPEESKLIDFSNFGETLGDDTMGNLFQTGLRLVDNALGSMVPDPDVDGPNGDGMDLGVNRLLRSTILNEDRALSVNVTDMPDTSGIIFEGHDMLTETTMTLLETRLFGLDSFREFDPLDSAGRYTLENNFHWEHLKVEMDIELLMKPSTKSDSLIEVGTEAEVKETITVEIGINGIEIDFHFLLAVDENEMGQLQLGSILNTTNLLPCVMKSFLASEVTGFNALVGDMEPPTLSGFISPGIDRLVSNAASAVYYMYEGSLMLATPNFFQITARNMTNQLLEGILEAPESNSCFLYGNYTDTDAFVHLGDLLLSREEAMSIGGSGDAPYGTVTADMMKFIRDEVQSVNPTTGQLYVNQAVANFTARESGYPGTVLFPSDLIDVRSTLKIGELRATMQLKVSDAKVENLDSLGLPLVLLEPTESNVVSNNITIGATGEPLKFASELSFGFSDGENIEVQNNVLLGLEMENAGIEVAALASILQSKLLEFPLEDINNLDCWLAMMPAPTLDATGVRVGDTEPTLALHSLKIAIETIKLRLQCISCSSPMFHDLADTISTEEATEDITRLINGIIEYVSSLVGGPYLQIQLDRMLAEAPRRCPHSPEYAGEDATKVTYRGFEKIQKPEPSFDFIFALGGVIATVVFAAFLSATVVKIVRHRRHSKWLDTLDETELLQHKKKQLKEQERLLRLNKETSSMFRSSVIPCWIRLLVPLVVIANIGFFLSGHLSLGASVDIDAHIGGEAVNIKQLFTFSMAQSVLDMWEAGAKELAILLAIFSGAWPYMKQLAVLFLWFASPKITSVSRRESVLLWLDALGKWSFIDIFILIMSVPSFRVEINSPDSVSFLPQDFYSVNLLLIPCWGLYSNMIAQLISQINSHFIIHYHRKIVLGFEKREENNEALSLHTHLFNRDGAKKGRLLKLRTHVTKVVTAVATAYVALIIAGSIVPSFSLSQFGLVGLAVEASPDQSTYNVHNIFSIVKLLTTQASFTGKFSDYVGLISLSVILVFTVIIVPIAQTALLLRRWFCKLDAKARLRNFVAIEALQAWQYVEVYVVSILIACWQLGSVSEFLINDYCGSLDSFFNALAYYGILRPRDAQCFQVRASVLSGSWILVAASVTLLSLNHFINSASKQQEIDVRHAEEEKLAEKLAVASGRSDSELFDEMKLKPNPPSFTDQYRWLLLSHNDNDDEGDTE